MIFVMCSITQLIVQRLLGLYHVEGPVNGKKKLKTVTTLQHLFKNWYRTLDDKKKKKIPS